MGFITVMIIDVDVQLLFWSLFFIILPSRSFLIEQLSQDVAEMLLVVQKEVEDDGTWLKPDQPRE